MPEMSTYSIPTILGQLQQLSLPLPSEEGLYAILETDGQEFLQALSKGLSGDVQGKKFVRLYCTATQGKVIARLQNKGITTTQKEILLATKKVGRDFFKNLLDWDEQNDPAAKRFVLDALRGEASPYPPQVVPAADKFSELKSVHVYGGKSALCFQQDQTRESVDTIRIEAAIAQNGKFQWNDKISIQISPKELPLVTALFFRFTDKIEGKGHGANNEKWFTGERQQGKIYFTLNSKGKTSCGVPIPAGDAYRVATLLLNALIANDPALDQSLVLRLIKIQGEMNTESQASLREKT